MAPAHLKRTITVAGAVFTLIGYIIGGSIFILPGELAASAGPGVFISYLLASIPALFLCFVGAQIGNVFPLSGANCISISTVIRPVYGFLFVWMVLVLMAFAVPPLAFGFADYLSIFFPKVQEWRTLTALLTIIGFVGVNLLGVTMAVWVQGLMVLVFMAALATFGIGGTINAAPENLTPLMPNGFGPVLAAVIPAYYSYTGFLMIISLGGEIKRPQRTIPISLAVGFIIIMATYTLVSIALPGVIPFEELEGMEAPVSQAAQRFLPTGVANAMTLAALLAMATSINGILLAKSRDLFALARDSIFPKVFGHVSRRAGVPDAAVALIGALAVLGLWFQGSFAQYASMVTLCVAAMQILTGLVVLMLPSQLPEHFDRAPFKLKPFWRNFWGGGLILLSGFLFALSVKLEPKSLLIFAVVVGAGVAFYHYRRRLLLARGENIEDLLRKDISQLIESDETPNAPA